MYKVTESLKFFEGSNYVSAHYYGRCERARWAVIVSAKAVMQFSAALSALGIKGGADKKEVGKCFSFLLPSGTTYIYLPSEVSLQHIRELKRR